MVWVIAFAISCVAATCAAVIADEKDRSVVGFALLAFVLPIVGIVVVVCLPKRTTAAPCGAAVGKRT